MLVVFFFFVLNSVIFNGFFSFFRVVNLFFLKVVSEDDFEPGKLFGNLMMSIWKVRQSIHEVLNCEANIEFLK